MRTDIRPGPDDRSSLHEHTCDICGFTDRTSWIRHAAVPDGWYILRLERGFGGLPHATGYVDLCAICGADALARIKALTKLARLQGERACPPPV